MTRECDIITGDIPQHIFSLLLTMICSMKHCVGLDDRFDSQIIGIILVSTCAQYSKKKKKKAGKGKENIKDYPKPFRMAFPSDQISSP